MTRFTDADLREFVARGAVAATVAGAAASSAVPAGRRRGREEDGLQRALCQYWEIAYPDTWAKTWHTPNGLAAKNKKLAGIFKGLGVKAGVFDLVCVARRGPYTGFALELKATDGRESVGQGLWAQQFFNEGWFVGIAYSLDVALRLLHEYHTLAPHPVGCQFTLPLPEVTPP
jgi:hypothetical protein